MLVSPIVKKKTTEKNSPPPQWFLPPPLNPKGNPSTPRDWTIECPQGLYVHDEVLLESTHSALLKYFENDVHWLQRFKRNPHSAHHNYMHTRVIGNDADAIKEELASTCPLLYQASHEVFEKMKSIIPPGTHAAFDNFAPESIAVHKHLSGWGLGAHYDNSCDVGEGLVLMFNVWRSNCDVTKHHLREFRFTDPPGGRKFSVFTGAKMGIVFTGNAYDYWKHESIRNSKQSGTCYSVTVRLKRVCGYGKTMRDNLVYKPGAGAAEEVAHKRIASLRKAGMSY